MLKTDVDQWLKQLRCDGISLGIQELLYYRSKINAFARHHKSLPRSSQAGPLLSKSRGRGMEFDEVRHYQAGDDIRSIDWRVTARTGKAHTKLYREEKERPVFIWVDLPLTQFFGSQFLFKSVQACHLAAALAWQAQHKGDRIGGLIGNGWLHQELKPAARQKGVLTLFHSLMEIHKDSLSRWSQKQQQQQNTLDENLKRLRQLVKPGSTIYVISDFYGADEHLLDGLRVLSQHNSLRCFGLYDPMEHELPEGYSPHPLAITDGQQQIDINLADSHQRQHYHSAAAQRWETIQQAFRQRRLSFTPVSSAIPLEQQWTEIT
ncbi:DUF58 domain-containing protein [Idiomarina sp. HP20-50]|uniref:DUF58 domain-containing protein n=1 Tax=Idiomarina sp. HP20-50 TaxID=3070813 RepID=UPI00294B1DB0|nr:DUF58 domain-containing protein [Idiomarina sp. HP20-50]MDV6315529.1 DUF58 domain-containing protein [Idiomarina sp. HP20-50]